MSVIWTALKPDICTFTLYCPVSIRGNEYRPSLLVVAFLVSPVSMRVNVTAAPETGNPDSSFTTPRTSVEVVCAHTAKHTPKRNSSFTKTGLNMRAIFLYEIFGTVYRTQNWNLVSGAGACRSEVEMSG